MNATKTRVRTIVEARVRIRYLGSPLEAPMSNSRCSPRNQVTSAPYRDPRRRYRAYPIGDIPCIPQGISASIPPPLPTPGPHLLFTPVPPTRDPPIVLAGLL